MRVMKWALGRPPLPPSGYRRLAPDSRFRAALGASAPASGDGARARRMLAEREAAGLRRVLQAAHELLTESDRAEAA